MNYITLDDGPSLDKFIELRRGVVFLFREGLTARRKLDENAAVALVKVRANTYR